MSKDLRKYARDTNFRLVAGFVGVLLLIGLPLIAMTYGKEAALTGLLCLAAFALPVFLIFLILKLLDFIVERSNEQ